MATTIRDSVGMPLRGSEEVASENRTGEAAPAVVGETRLETEEGRAEADLVERHRHGDQRAFEELYHRFSRLVYNVALRQCGSADQASDLSQEIFLRIYRGLARFRGGSTLRTWIYRICVNHCRSRLRRKRIVTEPLPERSDNYCVDGEQTPETNAAQREEERQMIRALREVDPVFRESLVLRDLQGLSYREIAEIVRVPIGTVRSRIARGREQLRVVLERWS